MRARRPPNMIAEIGTPCGSSQFGAIDGHCDAGAVKREFGWAPLRRLPSGSFMSGVQGFPFQSRAPCVGAGSSWLSHHTVLSSFRTTFV